MGYTTELHGEFACYHPENDHLGAFLQAVREGDRAAVAALANWLTERGDARGAAVAAVTPGDLRPLWRQFGLRPEHAAYLHAFNGTRRMKRDAQRAKALADPAREAVGLPIGPEAAYFVGGGGYAGQDRDESIVDYNEPPKGQPGLWCRWEPSKDAAAIVWDGGEKFYYYVEWMRYLLDHFLTPWGYVVNGRVTWQGEDEADIGTITVADNRLESRRG